MLQFYPDNHFDSIVTDPPREIDDLNPYIEGLRVLKAGGYLVAVCETKAYQDLTGIIQDAGFEILDPLQWIDQSESQVSIILARKAVSLNYHAIQIEQPSEQYFYSLEVGDDERNCGGVYNDHPAVKPIELMKNLICLVTPPGGRVLDPFNGSGSTGCAAVEMDCEYIGIDVDQNYIDISRQRIAAHYEATHRTSGVLFEKEKK
jgi:DNA modification methylase